MKEKGERKKRKRTKRQKNSLGRLSSLMDHYTPLFAFKFNGTIYTPVYPGRVPEGWARGAGQSCRHIPKRRK